MSGIIFHGIFSRVTSIKFDFLEKFSHNNISFHFYQTLVVPGCFSRLSDSFSETYLNIVALSFGQKDIAHFLFFKQSFDSAAFLILERVLF